MATTKCLPGSILICILLFVFLELNAHFPVLRFSSGAANQIAFVASCGLPWIAFVFGFSLQNARTRWMVCIAIVPTLLWSVVAAGGTLIAAGTGFQPVNRMKAGPSAIAIYRLNGGATTDFGLLIRQERRVLPGLELVKNLDLFYPAYSASSEIVGPNTISRLRPTKPRVKVM
jgi:hypothetical protein